MGVEAIGRTFALMPSESASFLLSRFLFFPDIALYRLAKRGGLRPRRSAIWIVGVVEDGVPAVSRQAKGAL